MECEKHAAEISGIDTQFPDQFGGRGSLAMRELVQHAHFGERKRTSKESAIQDADLARVEPVEAADVFNMRIDRHGTILFAPIVDSVKYLSISDRKRGQCRERYSGRAEAQCDGCHGIRAPELKTTDHFPNAGEQFIHEKRHLL